jgi:hypothetical protein
VTPWGAELDQFDRIRSKVLGASTTADLQSVWDGHGVFLVEAAFQYRSHCSVIFLLRSLRRSASSRTLLLVPAMKDRR